MHNNEEKKKKHFRQVEVIKGYVAHVGIHYVHQKPQQAFLNCFGPIRVPEKLCSFSVHQRTFAKSQRATEIRQKRIYIESHACNERQPT